MGRISKARRAAFEVLEAVADGRYASDELRIQSRNLDARDAGLASQIVFGSLRFQAQLDYLIFLYSGRRADELEAPVAIALRMAIFQVRYLERIPAHAAVDESVELVKRTRRAAVGLTNAVLRKANRDPVKWPDLATELSCPGWLLKRWEMHFGADQAHRIAQAALEVPEAYIRVPPGAQPPAHLALEVTEVPRCYRVLSGLRQNLRLHDVSSQAILPLLDLQPGNSYLDLCAAPGNKTVQALETELSLSVACDVSMKRIREIPAVCPRVVLDGSRPLPFAQRFDRVFVDAPCSGTGTIGRNPEIKWRVQERDFTKFRQLQVRIVNEGLQLLARGGKLLYATCSLEREENENAIAAVREQVPGVRCEREMWRIPGRDAGDGFYGAVLSLNA